MYRTLYEEKNISLLMQSRISLLKSFHMSFFSKKGTDKREIWHKPLMNLFSLPLSRSLSLCVWPRPQATIRNESALTRGMLYSEFNERWNRHHSHPNCQMMWQHELERERCVGNEIDTLIRAFDFSLQRLLFRQRANQNTRKGHP